MVPASPQEDLLVVLDEPGTASRVLLADAGQSPAVEAEQEPPADKLAASGEEPEKIAAADPAPASAASEEQATGTQAVAALAPQDDRSSAQTGTSETAATGGRLQPAETEQAAIDTSAPSSQTGDQTVAALSQDQAQSAGDEAPDDVAAVPEPSVTVEAVELEGEDKLFVAGAAQTQDPVRIYVDGTLVGEAQPGQGGRWLLETDRSLEPGQYAVRADQVERPSGSVVARAEVLFERQAEEEVFIPVRLQAEGAVASAEGAEITGNIRQPQSLIIRKGDNLWQISRRLYGLGIRYSSIYLANKDQIRDPDLIYPGQVFVIPKSDTAWQSGQLQAENNGLNAPAERRTE